jgi:hypothetical protein
MKNKTFSLFCKLHSFYCNNNKIKIKFSLAINHLFVMTIKQKNIIIIDNQKPVQKVRA